MPINENETVEVKITTSPSGTAVYINSRLIAGKAPAPGTGETKTFYPKMLDIMESIPELPREINSLQSQLEQADDHVIELEAELAEHQ